MIKIINVSKEVNKQKILDNISLELPDTGFVALSGEEISWGNELLNMLGGITMPTDGSIIVDNIVLTHKNHKELAKYRNDFVAFITNKDNLIAGMTVEENLKIVEETSEYETVVKSFNLSKILDKDASELSSEEEYRVVLARTVLKNPKIILVDEIDSSLNANAKLSVLKLLKSLSRKRLVVIISKDDYEIDEYIDMLVEFSGNKISKISRFKADFAKNEINPNKSKFPMGLFIKRYLGVFKYKILITVFLGIVAIWSLLLSSALESINYFDEHIKIIASNEDMPLVFKTSNDVFDEETLKLIENEKVTNRELEIGKSVGGINNAYSKFILGKYAEGQTPLYYKEPIDMYSYFDVNRLGDVDYGVMPIEAREIVINSYLAELIVELGVEDESGDIFKPSNFEELVNSKRPIKLGDKSVTVVGIKGVNLNDFEKLKSIKKDSIGLELFNEVVKSIGGNIFVRGDFYDLYSVEDECNPKFVFKYTESDGVIPVERRGTFKNSIVLNDDTLIRGLNKGEIIIGIDDVKPFGIYADTAVGSKIKLYVDDETAGETHSLEFVVKGISKDGKVYFNREDLSPYYWKGISINKVLVHESDEMVIKEMLGKTDENGIDIKSPYSSKFEQLEHQLIFPTKVLKVCTITFMLAYVICALLCICKILKKFKEEFKIIKRLGINDEKVSLSLGIVSIIGSFLAMVVAMLFFGMNSFLINHFVSSSLFYKLNLVTVDFISIMGALLGIIVINICLYCMILQYIKKIV